MEAEKIAKGLTEAQKDALRPWTPFDDDVGLSLVRLGLYAIPDGVDGVWEDTPLGLEVRRILEKRNDGE